MTNPTIVDTLQANFPNATLVRDEDAKVFLVKVLKYTEKEIDGAKLYAIIYPNNSWAKVDIWQNGAFRYGLTSLPDAIQGLSKLEDVINKIAEKGHDSIQPFIESI